MDILKFFIIFEEGVLHFHFALGPTNDVADPSEHVNSSQSHFKTSSKSGKLCQQKRGAVKQDVRLLAGRDEGWKAKYEG